MKKRTSVKGFTRMFLETVGKFYFQKSCAERDH